MLLDLPKFRHVEYLMNRPSPRYDLAWSNILPQWPGAIENSLDTKLISAGGHLGDEGLRSHIASLYGVDRSCVVLTNGCSEANTLALMTSLNRGDKVLIEKPIYTPLIELPRALGCDVHTIKRRPDDYRFDIRELREKIETLSPALFVMQNMNNPSGKALFEPELLDIVKVLSENQVPVLVDEVYRDFAMSCVDGKLVNAFPSMVELYDRAMITSSVTKVYGAGGLVSGWLVGSKRTANRARRLKIYTVPMVSHIGGRIAHRILSMRDLVMPHEFAMIREKLNLVSTWAKGRSDVHWSEPDGCAVGFLRYDHDLPSVEACERLYSEHQVRVVPGEFFHLENGFRLSVAGCYDNLKDGLREIDIFLDSL
ncbi:MAG: aminotransferase class I/II-fold pyridoxal phosphate-dependent enzyme [Candidatus Thermoplasmatota archaeon]|nr:aminotransferase class I/II-fold pyridoxal phosphate-dependent enzyme [Candidatus Thermoplasmatota archaeon]